MARAGHRRAPWLSGRARAVRAELLHSLGPHCAARAIFFYPAYGARKSLRANAIDESAAYQTIWAQRNRSFCTRVLGADGSQLRRAVLPTNARAVRTELLHSSAHFFHKWSPAQARSGTSRGRARRFWPGGSGTVAVSDVSMPSLCRGNTGGGRKTADVHFAIFLWKPRLPRRWRAADAHSRHDDGLHADAATKPWPVLSTHSPSAQNSVQTHWPPELR